jgi:hypothetical protein
MFPEIPFRIPALIVLAVFLVLSGLIWIFNLSWSWLWIAPVLAVVLLIAVVVFIASFTRFT